MFCFPVVYGTPGSVLFFLAEKKKKSKSLGKDLQAFFFEKAVSALRGKTRVFSFWLCVLEERTEIADGSAVRVYLCSRECT